ncbi:MAG: hypothetical protein H7A24_10885 [Leptospiraceae bacterium]|nr:hypothetical protein [Leptospiraceae bacterium]
MSKKFFFAKHHRKLAIQGRHIVSDSKKYLELLSPLLSPPESVSKEWIFCDSLDLNLPFETLIKVSRTQSPRYEYSGELNYFDSELPFERILIRDPKIKIDLRGRVTLKSAMEEIRRFEKLKSVLPYVIVRFEREKRNFLGYGGNLILDTNVRYYKPDDSGRMQLLGIDEFTHFGINLRNYRDTFSLLLNRINKLTSNLEILPLMSKRWLAFHYRGESDRIPVKTEVDGYEFETKIKLDNHNFPIISESLPSGFELCAITKNKSIRRYYKGNHVNIRGDQARWIIKGKTESIKGVRVRPEQKIDINVWSLAAHPELAQMTRIKRRIQIKSSHSQRIYTISLDRCDAYGKIFHQLEIEYNGLEEKFDNHHSTPESSDLPKSFLPMKNFIQFEPPAIPSVLKMDLISEIIHIREWITEVYNLEKESKTKRKWLLRSRESLLALRSLKSILKND